VNSFTRQILPTVSRKHLFMTVLYIESFCPRKTHNRTLLLSSTLLKHGHHFDYRNQPLNMRMCICYLDCHEAGLCCCLVVTHRRPITSITAVLLPFVTYLRTLPRTSFPQLRISLFRHVHGNVNIARDIYSYVKQIHFD
jgi:hypothetical protein